MGEQVAKHFISGQYVIAEIFCQRCSKQIGWQYIEAKQIDNEFKIGHFVVEEVNISEK